MTTLIILTKCDIICDLHLQNHESKQVLTCVVIYEDRVSTTCPVVIAQCDGLSEAMPSFNLPTARRTIAFLLETCDMADKATSQYNGISSHKRIRMTFVGEY